VRKIDFDEKNTIISRIVNLDKHLDLMILMSIKDKNFWELLESKILDSIIDKLNLKDVYKDFSVALENINSFLQTWEQDGEKVKWLSALVAILDKKHLLFSTLWTPSCYLINTQREVIEVTDREENRKNFWFISSGDVGDNEIVTFSTMRVLDYLSKSDLKDGIESWNLEGFTKNIKNILTTEKPWKNVGVIAFQNNRMFEEEPQESKFSYISYKMMQLLDNNITKSILASLMKLKLNFPEQTKKSKNYIFGIGIFFCFFVLYYILSSFIQLTSGTKNIETAQESLLKAKEYMRLASDNINNSELFSMNIESSEKLIQDIQTRGLFLSDVAKIQDDISILKKQFNGIETFETKQENTLYTSTVTLDSLKILDVSNKVYIATSNSIIGPIISGKTPEIFTFPELAAGDSFIDATTFETDILLMTRLGKVVRFSRGNFFSYVDVTNQPTWDESMSIDSYATNIYLLNKEKTQILRHKKVGTKFDAGFPYLSEEDAATFWKIAALTVDGWIYILKWDLSLVKVFRTPSYRVESIVLNKLPKNYDRDLTKNTAVEIYARQDLNYVYMLLENKILVFEPNSKRYQDVKSLTYLGQIEGKWFDIKDFSVDKDGIVFVLSDTWVYKMDFEINEGSLVVR
jgi:hypothetical protein